MIIYFFNSLHALILKSFPQFDKDVARLLRAPLPLDKVVFEPTLPTGEGGSPD